MIGRDQRRRPQPGEPVEAGLARAAARHWWTTASPSVRGAAGAAGERRRPVLPPVPGPPSRGRQAEVRELGAGQAIGDRLVDASAFPGHDPDRSVVVDHLERVAPEADQLSRRPRNERLADQGRRQLSVEQGRLVGPLQGGRLSLVVGDLARILGVPGFEGFRPLGPGVGQLRVRPGHAPALARSSSSSAREMVTTSSSAAPSVTPPPASGSRALRTVLNRMDHPGHQKRS